MKCLSIVFVQLLFWLSLTIFLMMGCNKKNGYQSTKNPYTETALPPNWVYNRLDNQVKVLIDHIKASPSLAQYFTFQCNKIGKPYWGKAFIDNRGTTQVCLVPLKSDKDSLFTGFIALEKDTSLHFRVYDGKKLSLYVGSTPSAVEVNHALNALNNYAFGSLVYSTKGLPLQDRNKLQQFKTSQTSSDRAASISITSCYSWSTCMGDGNGNCVGEIYHFTECITQTIWSFPSDGGYGSNSGGEPTDSRGGSGGGGGGGSHNTPRPSNPENAVAAAPRVPIPDITRHLSCFTPSLSAKVTIYVDQPTPGTTEPVSILGGIGHTFIGFEQVNNGQVIRRTIGFYAQTPVDPVKKKSAASILGDDAGRKYNVKWETTVSGEQFSEMLHAATYYADIYHLENYNCANFVLDVAQMGGITLPRTQGWWITGRGLNPGSLGEDIRQLPGSNGSRGSSAENSGTCQPPKVFF